MRIDILTLFPEMFAPLDYSIIKRARDRGIIEINLYNIRDYSKEKYSRVDDYPYGGGSGMVMMADPIYNAYEHVLSQGDDPPRVILTTPGGRVFDQHTAEELSRENRLMFICGHYEGIDERIKPIVTDELSIGDYVLTGGEIPSMVMVDAICRSVPGVLSSSSSYRQESFYQGLLEYPQYTRPEKYRGLKVPDVLLSGNHALVDEWRRYQSLKRTVSIRPDLIDPDMLSEHDRKIILDMESEG